MTGPVPAIQASRLVISRSLTLRFRRSSIEAKFLSQRLERQNLPSQYFEETVPISAPLRSRFSSPKVRSLRIFRLLTLPYKRLITKNVEQAMALFPLKVLRVLLLNQISVSPSSTAGPTLGSVSSRECLDAPAILATFTAGHTTRDMPPEICGAECAA